MNQTSRPKLFLSSTFIDLSEIRQELSQFLSGIFDIDLVIMETFGSDAASPNVNSARRVYECDIFVGLYAHRYGTIDQKSGKSITEIELDAARQAYSSGTLTDILLYFLDAGASWPSEKKEQGSVAEAGLNRLRAKAKQHTYTLFRDRNDLLFHVLRDVYRRVVSLVATQPLRARKIFNPTERNPHQPIGMEYLTSEFRAHLIGRHKSVDELTETLFDDPVVLLLGDSGVGKTSLIHAGLFPALTKFGWRLIYTRSFGFPYDDIVRQLRTAGFEAHQAFQEHLRQTTVFVASHHGRTNGYCEDVFEYCSPFVVVFSDGPKQYATQEEATTYAKHAKGIQFNGETRYVLTTRNDGSLTWESN